MRLLRIAFALCVLALTAVGVQAEAAPSTFAVRSQTYARVTITKFWSPYEQKGTYPGGRLRLTGLHGDWIGMSLVHELPEGETFDKGGNFSQVLINRTLACPLAECAAVPTLDLGIGARVAPGHYVVVIFGAAGATARLEMSKLPGKVSGFSALPTGSQLNVFEGVGPAEHQPVLEASYVVVPLHRHSLSGVASLRAFTQPAQMTEVACASDSLGVAPLAGPASCRGFSFLYGPETYLGSGALVSGYYSLGNVNPYFTHSGDAGYHIEATAPKSHLLVIDWQVALPF